MSSENEIYDKFCIRIGQENEKQRKVLFGHFGVLSPFYLHNTSNTDFTMYRFHYFQSVTNHQQSRHSQYTNSHKLQVEI